MNVRVRKPREPKNSARKPVNSLWLNASISTMAHATRGMFRKNDPIPLASTVKNGFARVVLEPESARKSEKTAATIVEAMEIKTVSHSFSRMSGSFFID